MRIMALGDSHGDLHYLRNALDFASKSGVDIIFIVGDFGIWDHTRGGVRFLENVNERSSFLGIPVYFCDGNHENFSSLYGIPISDNGFRYVRQNIIHAPRGHIWKWDDVTFMAMGGAHSIDGPGGVWAQTRGPRYMRGVGDVDLGAWWPEETITDEEVESAIANIEKYNDSINVIFTHDVPEGASIPGIEGYPLGNINRQRLAKVVYEANPEIVIAGHYHRRHSTGLLKSDTRIEILASNNESGGQFIFIDTDPFTVYAD